MADWSDLEIELDRWAAAGEVATFWWRDDDARAPTGALDRLLDLARRHGLPLHLAVVPEGLDPRLSRHLSGEPDVFTLQHGFSHENHEPVGQGASEMGDHRDTELQLRDLREGWERLRAAELPNLITALAPPWNRIADGTVGHLSGLGYRILSTSFPRTTPSPAAGLTQVNVHFDPIRWKEGPRFRGEARILDGICRHLADRRQGLVDRDEPTGMLTHHLQTDVEVWDFVDRLLGRLSDARVRWVRLVDLAPPA